MTTLPGSGGGGGGGGGGEGPGSTLVAGTWAELDDSLAGAGRRSGSEPALLSPGIAAVPAAGAISGLAELSLPLMELPTTKARPNRTAASATAISTSLRLLATTPLISRQPLARRLVVGRELALDLLRSLVRKDLGANVIANLA